MPKKKEPEHPVTAIVPVELVEERIFVIRGHKVMLGSDLAEIYGVTPKRLNEQVKRNHARFPEDFMFQLTMDEAKGVLASRSQFATLKRGQNIKYAPYVFTEHGAVMLATVLNTPLAVEASVQVVRAFVRLRSILAAHKELARKLEELEQKHDAQAKKTEGQYKAVLELIRRIIKGQEAQAKGKQPIGFRTDEEKKKS